MRHRLSVLLTVGVALAAAPAKAQVAPSAPPPAAGRAAAPQAKPAGKAVDALTITGASQNGFRSAIDRRSYGIAGDLATTTGSIADALRNIPSVEVDPQGALSLRGSSNVTIMIDGKPSAQLKGPNGALGLQSIPADSIERVEVITNPSAEFSPEGSVGIINLITKQVRKPGRSGSARLNLGAGGRLNGGVTGAYNVNGLTLAADASAQRRSLLGAEGYLRQTSLDGRGHVLGTNLTRQVNTGDLDAWNAHTGIDYDLTPRTRLSGEARFNHYDSERSISQHLEGRDPAGDPVLVLDGLTPFGGTRNAIVLQSTLRHSFTGDDHTLTVDASHEHSRDQGFKIQQTVFTLPPAPDLYGHLQVRNPSSLTDVKADYSRPMPSGGRLKTGYDLRIEHNDYGVVGLRGTAADNAAPDPTQTDLFGYRQSVNAAYATYERPIGAWTVLAGLRLENAHLRLADTGAALRQATSDFHAYPSLHLARKLSDGQQVSLSYSKRVQRPTPQDLDPFQTEINAVNRNSGNPALKPQFTDSFEAGYQYKNRVGYYLATLYYRRSLGGVTDIVTPLGGGLLLNTKANLTNSRAAGLELVANGHLSRTLSYNVSSNLYWNQIDAMGQSLAQVIDFQGRRSAFAAGGRGSFTWQATPKDVLQVGGVVNAKRLTPQGYRDPTALTFLGYRHKFDDSLALVVTVQDAFHTFAYAGETASPVLITRDHFRTQSRWAFLGLTWTFSNGSAKRPRDTGFDFGGPPAP